MNIAQHIDVAIPIISGILILAFPQTLTNKDLALPENQKTKKTLKIAGVMVLAAGILVLSAQLMK